MPRRLVRIGYGTEAFGNQHPVQALPGVQEVLCADGARGGSPTGIDRAIFAYNHAGWYVTEVLSWAARYASPASSAIAVPLPADMASRP